MKCSKCPAEAPSLIRVQGQDLCLTCAFPIIQAMKDKVDELAELRGDLEKTNKDLADMERALDSLGREKAKLEEALATAGRDVADMEDQISAQHNFADKIEGQIAAIVADQAKDAQA